MTIEETPARVVSIKKNTPEPAPVTLSPLGELRASLAASFVERTEAIDAVLTAVVAGEHCLMLGPPGTAKSQLARTLAAGCALPYWELLLTRFTTPEEVFGPVKLSALQADRYERAVNGYLPTAGLVFLDEVFKANSAILNALLTALNEKVFHNGGLVHHLPLRSCIAASNELPEGPELGALFDRFLVRLHVDYVQDRDAFIRMLTAAATLPKAIDIVGEGAAAARVQTPPGVFEALAEIRISLKRQGLVASDRRWRKCLPLFQAVAHLDGRSAVEAEDFGFLEHVLWRTPDERADVVRLVQQVINPSAGKAIAYLDAAEQAFRKIPDDAQGRGPVLAAIGETNGTFKEMLAKLDKLTPGKKVSEVRKRIEELHAATSKRAVALTGLKL